MHYSPANRIYRSSNQRPGLILRRGIFLCLCMAVLLACVPHKVVKYTSFHEREFSERKELAAVQSASTGELLKNGYLLIGYIDLHRNVRTCYEDSQCVRHSDATPSNDELRREAARVGGDVLTLLEDRTTIEQNDKSICTNTTSTVISVTNNIPQVVTTCVAYRTVPGKREAKISRALIWRLDPEAARGEANARAIDAALKTLEAAYSTDSPRSENAPGSSTSSLPSPFTKDGKAAPGNTDPLSMQVLLGIRNNDTHLLYTLARDGKLQNWKDEKGRSALMVSILAEKFEATQTLLAIDRGLERRDANNMTAMHYAVGRADLPLVQKFAAAGHNLRQKTPEGLSLLHFSLWNPKLEVFEWLVKQGLDPRERLDQGTTTLMAAASSGNEALVRRLLDIGVEINLADVNGVNALMNAAAKGHVSVVRMLIKAGAKTDLRDTKGNTALHHAAGSGKREVLQTLLQNGMDINAVNVKDSSPLIVAVATGSWDAANYLMDRGARLTTGTLAAEDTAMFLISKNQPKLLQRYLNAFPPLKELVRRDPDWLQYAAKTSGSESIRFMVEIGARIDRPGTDGLTPLMTAAVAGNEQTVRALMDLKANPTLRDTRRQTALRKATMLGHAKVVGTLREFGVKE